MKRITEKSASKTKAKNKQKNKTVAKKQNTNNVKKIIPKIIVLLVIILVIASIVFLSSMFKVNKIEINVKYENGQVENSKLNIEELQTLSGVTVGQNMFEKSKQEITDALKKNSYVDKVEIKRKLSGVLCIEVIEREPKYLINYAGSYIYIDDQGYVLEVNPEALNLPVLLGVSTDFTSLAVGVETEKISRLDSKDLDKLSMVNDIMNVSKNNDIEGLISRIDITNDDDYIVYLDSESKVVYLGDCSDLNTRILYMKSIVRQESGNKGEIFINKDLASNYVFFRAGE